MNTLHKSAFVLLELSKLQEEEWMKQSPDLLSVHLQPENQRQKLTDICFLHISKPLKLVPVFCIKNRSPRSGPVTWKWLFSNFGSL